MKNYIKLIVLSLFFLLGCNDNFYKAKTTDNFTVVVGDVESLNNWVLWNQDKQIVSFNLVHPSLNVFLIQHQPKSNNNFEIQKQRKFTEHIMSDQERNLPITDYLETQIKKHPEFRFISFQCINARYFISLCENKD